MEDEKERDGVIVGIDLGQENTFVSYYVQGMEEPDTISTVMGSETFQIPTVLAKKKGLGQWFFGNDALSQVRLSMAVGADGFLEKAWNNEKLFLDSEEYEARDLLSVYIKKLLTLPVIGFQKRPLSRLVIAMEHMDRRVHETFVSVCRRLSIEPERLLLIDYSESFYYYALSQKPELYRSDVLLFDYNGGRLMHCLLTRNRNTTPETVNLTSGNDGELLENRDRDFDEILAKVFEDRTISSVFLIGSGFDGDWMKASLQRMLRTARVFMGKNLYSKGACYAGIVERSDIDWPFVYIGDNELKVNISIKVLDRNEMKFVTLLTAGDNWYETKGECEAILDGSPEIECWLQKPDERTAEVFTIPLSDMPKRENRTTRLRIEAAPVSDTEVKITVRDLGFGEISPQTKKTWTTNVKASAGTA